MLISILADPIPPSDDPEKVNNVAWAFETKKKIRIADNIKYFFTFLTPFLRFFGLNGYWFSSSKRQALQ
jgi:hypothetical protein